MQVLSFQDNALRRQTPSRRRPPDNRHPLRGQLESPTQRPQCTMKRSGRSIHRQSQAHTRRGSFLHCKTRCFRTLLALVRRSKRIFQADSRRKRGSKSMCSPNQYQHRGYLCQSLPIGSFISRGSERGRSVFPVMYSRPLTSIGALSRSGPLYALRLSCWPC